MSHRPVRPVLVAAGVLCLGAAAAIVPGCTTSSGRATATPTVNLTFVVPTSQPTPTAWSTYTPTGTPSGSGTSTRTPSGTMTPTSSPTVTCTPGCDTYADAAHATSQSSFCPPANAYAGAVCLPPFSCARFVWLDPVGGTYAQQPNTTVPGSGLLSDVLFLPSGAMPGTWTLRAESCSGSPLAVSTFVLCGSTVTATESPTPASFTPTASRTRSATPTPTATPTRTATPT